MNRTARRLVGCLALSCAFAATAAATGNTVEKFALVIGNQNYASREGELKNTMQDAALMARSLKTLGFSVTERNNLTRTQLLAAVEAFATRLPAGATALVYYAGHGMQVGGGNYLVPVDMELTSEQAVPVRAYPLQMMLERLSAARSAVNIVVLDACRNNPFQPRRPVRYRSFVDLGLASIQAPRGTLIAYSTAPGQLAADGKEANSVYTEALAKVILEPKLELREVFEKTASQVRKRTLDDQIPWLETSLTEKYYFLPPEGVTVVAGKPVQMADARPPDAGLKRGNEGMAETVPAVWFDNLSNLEWTNLDLEIRRRVEGLSRDEIPALEHLAEGGSVVAQTTLGLVYLEGQDKAVNQSSGMVTRSSPDNTKAVSWLLKAANAGFTIAQVELGELYYNGREVTKNLDESGRWLEMAARSNFVKAKADLQILRGASRFDVFKTLTDQIQKDMRQGAR